MTDNKEEIVEASAVAPAPQKEVPRWTLDRNIQEIEDQLSPLCKRRNDLYSMRWELKNDIANYFAKEALGDAVYHPLEEIALKLKENDDKLHNYQVKVEWYERKRLEDENKKLYEDRNKSKIPVLAAMQSLEDKARLVVAYALDIKGYVRFSCYQDFDHFKTPSECGKCNIAYENVQRAGLLKYFPFEGDRIYRAKKDEVEKIIFGIVPSIKDKENAKMYSERIKQLKAEKEPDSDLIKQLCEKQSILQKYQEEEKQKLQEELRKVYAKFDTAVNLSLGQLRKGMER